MVSQERIRGNWRAPLVFLPHGVKRILLTINNRMEIINESKPAMKSWMLMQRLFNLFGGNERKLNTTSDMFDNGVFWIGTDLTQSMSANLPFIEISQ